MLKILVVDDEPAQRDTLCRGIRLMGHRCLPAADCREALEQLDARPPDVLVTDMTMPGESGLLLITRARQRRPDLPVIIISGLLSNSDLDAARDMGIPVLQKPFNPDQLEDAIHRLTRGRPCR
jgi:DNA-binding response OmpR family regulator